MVSLKPLREAKFQDDVYKVWVRGSRPELVLNAGYTGLRVVSCPSGEVLREFAFPEPIESFPIESGAISPDGSRCCLFGREDSFALEVEFQEGAMRRVALSSHMGTPSGLCWFAPALHVWDHQQVEWYVGHDRFMPVKEEWQREAVPQDFRAALRGLSGFTVTKMHPGWQGFYVLSEDGERIGYIPREGRSLLASQDGSAIDATHHGEHLFVCFENEVVHHGGSQQQVVLRASPDEFFLSVNMVEVEGQPLLCLLTSSQDYTLSVLKFFELAP
ncbi:hypothetical protein [Pyxidicoccus xibeiensis]|uniref:hypothetical protein n=1 Tax=Pyxidicoccus xibeiensis TaxID=2906759 RepID=UPI0020A7AD67|nr:hypothetical protein [Pyxidicoccus xibeiensis]MCP3145320.1 hypothetical protein [Pyxidicoccus xibeiensis]